MYLRKFLVYYIITQVGKEIKGRFFVEVWGKKWYNDYTLINCTSKKLKICYARRISMKKTNNLLYIILTIISIICCGASLFFDATQQAFTMLASIGCSGVVSVLVAWLLERSNERIQRIKDKEILNCLLAQFDINIKCEMQRALLNCCRLKELDIDNKYTISEICTLLNKLSSDHIYFRHLPAMLEKSIQSISPTILLNCLKNNNGVMLYNHISTMQNYINILKLLEENKVESDTFKLIGIDIIATIAEIHKFRGIDEKYAIPENSKKYIIAKRQALQRKTGPLKQQL